MTGRDRTHATDPAATQRTVMLRFVVMLAVWTAVTTSANLLLPRSPEASWYVLMVIVAMVLPPLGFLLGYRTHRGFRQIVLGLDFTAITAVQGMRIAGIAMLSLWAAGSMAPAFALWAGGIDVFIGLTAVPMAFLITPLRPVRRRALRHWHTFGLLDFAVAIPLGVASTPRTDRRAGRGPVHVRHLLLPVELHPDGGSALHDHHAPRCLAPAAR